MSCDVAGCTCTVDEDICPVCDARPCPECHRRFGHDDGCTYPDPNALF